ncbi:DUF2244 domain-containing protein [Pseudooceanicola spongiae]|uniref:DUF2244 domain-containing protein n=1 Tax=Pseudooceanicola spongiae TaxID=2613965 RepID=A0A7L9WKU3_9RHOB|nr:DUF2244 domain-containing protein [Pseudooceanicola spongiae]QOL81021.1 DUF2244 domain-containing protein [Pseudooceanicola spongiae]
MPYHWHDPGRLELTPHRSLPPQGFAVVIGLFFSLAMVPLFTMLGSPVLWGLLPFAMIALGALWWALRRSYRDGMILERLHLDEDSWTLLRDGPRNQHHEWQCKRYWVRVQMHETSGRVPFYITLSGNGREVEIGAFLSEDERKALFPELLNAASRKTDSPN